MSILSTIRELIKGSQDAETATANLMQVLASEAIKTGDPDALVAVAAQWQELLEGRTACLPALASTAPGRAASASAPATITLPDALRPHVLTVMRSAYSGGCIEVTTVVIQKGVDRLVREAGGWSDADLEDASNRPGVQQPRWKITLSSCLRDMRNAGEIRNDARAWKTYTLAPHMLPALPETPVQAVLEPSWELVQTVA